MSPPPGAMATSRPTSGGETGSTDCTARPSSDRRMRQVCPAHFWAMSSPRSCPPKASERYSARPSTDGARMVSAWVNTSGSLGGTAPR